MIPDTVTTIAKYAFSCADNLLCVVIPDTVTTIGEWAFFSADIVVIYCEAKSQPIGWHSEWNSDNQTVVWGHSLGA